MIGQRRARVIVAGGEVQRAQRRAVRQPSEDRDCHRVGFSGGGNHGQFHHGPAPFILHVHFNIMPLDLRDKYLVGTQVAGLAKKLEDFLASINARF